jgi:hypothetical protein
MASAAKSSAYSEIIGDRRLRWMVAPAFFGRLPSGVEALAAVLFFSAETGPMPRLVSWPGPPAPASRSAS